jgi:collagenase-like PrtC family protease
MEYTIGCNWDPELIEKIDYPEVKSIFAGLPDTLISGGRPSILIQPMDENSVKQYIKRVHDKGWNFDFNVNSMCLANQELTAEGHREIVDYFGWISDLGVDTITVSIPLLVEISKKYYPKMKVNISTFQKVNSVPTAKRYEDLGADLIMLAEYTNRDFKLLKAIRKGVRCKLALIANTGCVHGCVNLFAHANSIAHSGAKGGNDTVFTESYQTYCVSKRLENTAEWIKIRWIRPEDVGFYEELGIDMLKIIDRHSITEALAERIKAYSERSFQGNLLDFLGQMVNRKKSMMMNLDRVFGNKNDQEIGKIKQLLNVFAIPVSDLLYLDNQKIPQDFLQGFMNRDCSRLSCNDCDYCQKIADIAVTVRDESKLNATVEKLKNIRAQMVDGSVLY